MRLASLPGRAALALLAVLALGCHVGNGPVVLRDFRRSAPDEQASDDFWADASSWAESSKSPEEPSFEVTLWLLPTWVSGRATSLGPQAESVSNTTFQCFDLGVALLPCPRERRRPRCSAKIRIGTTLQQKRHHLPSPPACGNATRVG